MTVSLGRQFPHRDSCWVEVRGTKRYARIPFMWETSGDEVFESSMRRQVEAFARALGGGACEGARRLTRSLRSCSLREERKRSARVSENLQRSEDRET
jgi:hypothetical protein